MGLTREDLENDVLRKSYEHSTQGLPLVPPAEFERSLERILATGTPGEDTWVFGYGSLIWNPLFHHVERQPATVHGFHRSFCLRSRMGRGSVEQPGLVLGLDFGGCCHGVAFRIAAEHTRHELTLLWRREMVLGSYAPRWVKVRAEGRALRALAFVVNHAHPHYAGKLAPETVVSTLASARGKFGSGADYLFQTVDCLIANGIHDPHLVALRERVLAATGGTPQHIECPEIGA
jgi:glutathione-specific gamma-glutamylcyclotransferase